MNGFRIIDITQVISGLMATRILSNSEADVIKIGLPPQGDIVVVGSGYAEEHVSALAAGQAVAQV